MITHTVSCSPYRISYSHLWPEIGSDLSAPNLRSSKILSFLLSIRGSVIGFLQLRSFLRITYSLSVSYLVTALALAPNCNDPVLHVWLPPTATWCLRILQAFLFGAEAKAVLCKAIGLGDDDVAGGVGSASKASSSGYLQASHGNPGYRVKTTPGIRYSAFASVVGVINSRSNMAVGFSFFFFLSFLEYFIFEILRTMKIIAAPSFCSGVEGR